MELSADYVASRAGTDTRELREAKLQLKSGSAEGLLFAVEKLFGDQSLKLTWQGRAADDRRLAHDKSEVRCASGYGGYAARCARCAPSSMRVPFERSSGQHARSEDALERYAMPTF